jgi:hypothetical protein
MLAKHVCRQGSTLQLAHSRTVNSDSNVFYSYVADPSVKQLRFEYIATMRIISAIIIGLMVGAIAKHATGLESSS